MNFLTVVILSFSILVPGVIGIVRFRKINKSYYPFLYFLWIAGANEIQNVLSALNGFNTIIQSNSYVLIEALLLTSFFRQQRIIGRRTLVSLSFAIVAVWVTDSIIFNSIWQLNLYFRIFYSFLVVLISITGINNYLVNSRKNLIINSSFLICICFIVYYTYRVLVEAFWIYGLNSSTTFQMNVYIIMIYINLTINVIYAFAVLWMPKRQAFILPS